ncbi:DUF6862 domain-containing protein, partial [Agarivorans sp. Alg241-V36]|uniref:DUF6862 domain-containing protein n=1 Tax=Agarivorans sp. Alg241-V36 TaxID=2305992 RepID=UPI0013D2783D
VETLNTLGQLEGGQALSLNAQSVSNSGSILAQGDATLNSDSIDNSGALVSNQVFTLNADSLHSSGQLQGGQGVLIDAAEDATFSAGSELASGGDLQLSASDLVMAGESFVTGDSTLSATHLTHSGVFTGLGNAELVVSQALINAGELSVNGGLVANAGSFTNSASGQMNAGTSLRIDANTLTQAGQLTSGVSLALVGTNLNHTGTSQSIGEMQLSAANNADLAGRLLSNDSILVTGSGITQAGQLSAAKNIDIDASSVAINGELYSGLTSSVNADSISFSNTASVDANNINLSSTGLLLNQGALVSQQQINVAANDFDNRAQVAAGASIAANAEKISNSGAISSNSNISLNANNTLTNSSSIHSLARVDLSAANLNQMGEVRANQLSLNASSILNHDGVSYVSGATTLNAGTGSLVQSGTLVSGGDISLIGGSIQLASGSITDSLGKVSIVGNSLTNLGKVLANLGATVDVVGSINNSGEIQTAGVLNLEAANLYNNGSLSGHGLVVDVTGVADNRANADIQSTNGLLIDAQSIKNSGHIAATNDITFNSSSDFTQLGSVHSFGSITANAGSALTNSGEILANDDIKLNASGKLLNTGELEAGRDINLVSSANAVVNQGDVIANRNLSITSYQSINNQNKLNAKNNLSLLSNTGTLVNSGDVIADKALSLTTQGSLTLQGGISAGTDLSLNTNGNIVNNASLQAGRDINLASQNFTNNSTVNAGEDLVISANGSITNNGALVSGQDMELSASNINNVSSLLYAGRNMALYTTNSINNTYGDILANNNLVMQRSASGGANNLVKNSSGTIQTINGDITINTQHLLNQREVFDIDTYTSSGEDAPASITLDYGEESFPDVQVNNHTQNGSGDRSDKHYQSVSATGGMSFTKDGDVNRVIVSNSSSSGQIIAGRNMSINAATVDNFYSLIHANGNLALTGNTLANLSAQEGEESTQYVYQLDRLENNRCKSAGWGHSCKVNLNNVRAVFNLIDSQVTRSGGTLYQGTISAGDTITANFTGGVNNELLSPYSPTQNVQDQNTGPINVGSSSSASQGGAVNNQLSHGQNQSANAAVGRSHGQSANGGGVVSGSTQQYVWQNLVGGVSGNQAALGNTNNNNQSLQSSSINSIGSSNGTVDSQQTNHIGSVADRDAAVNGSLVATNGGFGSHSLDSHSAQSGAVNASAIGSIGNALAYVNAEQATTRDTQQDLGANNVSSAAANSGSVSAMFLGALGGAYSAADANAGQVQQNQIRPLGLANANVQARQQDGVALTHLQGANSVPVPSYPLPSANGLFITSPNPDSGYLIETNPALTDFDQFIGSDYLFDEIGFNPDDDILRLGDAYYDTRVIMQAIFEQTGQRYLAQNIGSELEQMQQLLANAAEANESLGLTVGISLSQEQVANLTADIVWWETIEVNGQQVLAPKLYLANADQQNFKGGLVAGGDINIKAEELNNQNTIASDGRLHVNVSKDLLNDQGRLSANDDLILAAGNNITNISGELSGNNVALVAGRDITNKTWVSQDNVADVHTRTDIGNIASINADGDLLMQSGGDVVGVASEISAKGNAQINTGGDLNLVNIDDTHHLLVEGKWKVTEQESTKSINSVLSSGENLSINVQGSLNSIASDISANGDIAISAGTGLNLIAANESSLDRVETGWGKNKDISQSSQQKGNEVNAGGNLSLASGGDSYIQGGELNANGSLSLETAGEAIFDVTTDSEYSLHRRESSSFWGDNLLEIEKSTTSREGVSLTGENITVNSKQDLTLVASELDSNSNITLSSSDGSVNLLSANDENYYRKDETSSGFFVVTSGEGETATTANYVELRHQGELSVEAANGIVVDFKHEKGQSIEQSLQAFADNPDTAWIAELQGREDIDWQQVTDAYDSWEYHNESLSGPAAAIIAIAVAAVTAGTGLAAAAGTMATNAAASVGMNATLAGAVGAAGSAGTASLVNQAAMALANNKGDIGGALSDLGSSDTVKGLATAMVTAGALNGFDAVAGFAEGTSTSTNTSISTSTAAQASGNPIISIPTGEVSWASLGRGLAHSTLQSGVDTAINGGSFSDSLLGNLQNMLANEAHASASGLIGDYSAELGGDGSLSKGLVHAAAGGAAAELAGGDFAAGAASGLATELSSDLVRDNFGDEHAATVSGVVGSWAGVAATGKAEGAYTGQTVGETVMRFNHLSHAEASELAEQREGCNSGNQSACERVNELNRLDYERDQALNLACQDMSSAACQQQVDFAEENLASYEGNVSPFDEFGISQAYGDVEREASDPSGAIREQQIGGVHAAAGLLADFTPGVGDAKGFAEAESNMDYLLATVGLVPVAGDLIKKAADAFDTGDISAAQDLVAQAMRKIDESPKLLEYKPDASKQLTGGTDKSVGDLANVTPHQLSSPSEVDELIERDTTTLWRAVELEELADVQHFGDYNIHPNSTFKRFAFDEMSLDDFATANPGRVYTKTYIELPTDRLGDMIPHPDPGGVEKAIGIDVYEYPEFYDWFDGVNIKND